MNYNLKKDNYKKFDAFADGISAPRSYFIPFSSVEELEKTDIRTERYHSSRVAVLSGEWKFKYYEKHFDLPECIDTDSFEADDIMVPSVWQHTGYEKPYYVNIRYPFRANPPHIPEDCSVGVYIKKFRIEDISGSYSLAFLGVAGGLDVFFNGKHIGYSEGSHNTSEFDITELLQEGDNEVVAVVHKWCCGTYLESQDMFRCNGIFRDVLIIRTGDNSIYDFEAKTTYNGDGSYMLDVIPSFKIKDEVTFTAEIRNGDHIIASKSVNVCPGKTDKLTFDVLDVEEWSAEIPNLYDLYLILSKNEETQEVIRKRIGFKHIEIKRNVFYFNNKRIKLLGVNHHDTDPKAGYVMTVDDMERDIKIFKDYNVNCVRTSHYPPDPIFLDLCDEYGVYVVDEADIETHGVNELNRPNFISNNLQWKNHYWDRVSRMFQRDKNHPSITMWSLGNEAGGYRCQDYCYKNLKELTSIPIHYEGACRTIRWSYDVHSEMYTNQNICRKIAAGRGLPKRYYKKPFYLCEYAHAMGVGAGDLEEYVELFYSSDIMMGGCIWEFVDHAIYHEDGQYKYTYGGDHGEWRHDGNFCVDGLFNPDRTPHTGALQMKCCYRPIRAKLISENEFSFSNRNFFKTEKCTVKYSVRDNGIETENGEIDLSIEPSRSVTEKINYKIGGHTVIVFTYFNGDFEIAKEQIVLGGKYITEKTSCDNPPRVDESEKKLFISCDNAELIYNTATGEFESYLYEGEQLINQTPLSPLKGFNPSLYRAPIDNDMYIRKQWTKKGLENLSARLKPSKHSYTCIGNNLHIKSEFKLATPRCTSAGKLRVDYIVNSKAEIQVKYTYDGLKFKNVPRLGLLVELPKKFNTVEYYGYDKLTMSDFKEHAEFAISKLSVSDMHEVYIKPQESSARYNTYWAELTDENGIGIRIESENSFTFTANHFNAAQCAKANHIEDLKEYDTTVVHIDGFMLGAGSNACGPLPLAGHIKKRVDSYTNGFTVKPIGKRNV